MRPSATEERIEAGAAQPTGLPLVSVVIPVLDCVDDVQEGVRALRAQDYPADRFEILIVDNGSTDGTVERLRREGGEPLLCPERGRSRALNVGLARARGDIICSTDISCRPEPGWISAVVRCFADPAVGCVAGEIRQLEAQDDFVTRLQRHLDYMSPMAAQRRTRAPFLPYADGANASFRRAVFDAIGPFEERFIKAADVEICYRMLFLTDYKLAFCRAAAVWEPGEASLAKLLKQRYRIGIGNVLLEARFPGLFRSAPTQGGQGWRRAYWRLWQTAASAGRTVGALLQAPFSAEHRFAVYSAWAQWLMTAAQRAGQRHARRDGWYAIPRPEALESPRIDDYRRGSLDIRPRVVAVEGARPDTQAPAMMPASVQQQIEVGHA